MSASSAASSSSSSTSTPVSTPTSTPSEGKEEKAATSASSDETITSCGSRKRKLEEVSNRELEEKIASMAEQLKACEKRISEQEQHIRSLKLMKTQLDGLDAPTGPAAAASSSSSSSAAAASSSSAAASTSSSSAAASSSASCFASSAASSSTTPGTKAPASVEVYYVAIPSKEIDTDRLVENAVSAGCTLYYYEMSSSNKSLFTQRRFAPDPLQGFDWHKSRPEFKTRFGKAYAFKNRHELICAPRTHTDIWHMLHQNGIETCVVARTYEGLCLAVETIETGKVELFKADRPIDRDGFVLNYYRCY